MIVSDWTYAGHSPLLIARRQLRSFTIISYLVGGFSEKVVFAVFQRGHRETRDVATLCIHGEVTGFVILTIHGSTEN